MNWLLITQIVLSVLLVLSIIFQDRGAGLGEVFGGAGAVHRTKRGPEKVLYISTIIFAIAFIAVALVSIII
ncbi:MAG: preprotein translocase subunit SecG [Candidatus Jacksonbacteria bacterium]|jgi:preprotein translocase subunit SecG|nr:preprotein translocase subunit SecG [Candidatus Jacksonbacteria bacterium]MBT6034492.1 preprotein translocase subunit SecG [Candidatus Jacksonbacteria bacterium]MBT6301470.1 preprotein translocase subunit SecG [Candidatus Jacksonbacteria bacterium]MBT6757145.1 preprotein translocase subunit SecG [Candidatus Jacksonbacteria bacterium]MBT6955357.1 preprotein translocase subunit SecG [Candidatus Jacksonbacteria bacterium]